MTQNPTTHSGAIDPTTVYDALVVGMGPAGGQTARELSRRGRRVLLIDRLKTFEEKNFSSAGTLRESLREFALPESIVNANWQGYRLVSTLEETHKRLATPVGVVLEFSALRRFLADDAAKYGAATLLQHSFVESRVDSDGLCRAKIVDLASGTAKELRAKIIVDATGPSRQILGRSLAQKPLWGFAQEWVLRYPGALVANDELLVFVGKQFAPNGYGWIFPNGIDEWKVGYGNMSLNEKKTHSLIPYIQQILDLYFPDVDRRQIVEKHGSFLCHTLGMRDNFWNPRRKVIAVGDATSLCNPLLGEGIRHALRGGMQCADTVDAILSGRKISARHYRRKLTGALYWKWLFCEKYAIRSYLHKNDRHWDRTIQRIERLPADSTFDLLFRYNFMAFPRLFWNFLLNLLREKFGLAPVN